MLALLRVRSDRGRVRQPAVQGHIKLGGLTYAHIARTHPLNLAPLPSYFYPSTVTPTQCFVTIETQLFSNNKDTFINKPLSSLSSGPQHAPVIVVAMPSPPLLSTKAKSMATTPTSPSRKYRQVAYHADNRGRYVVQSCEVRSSSCRAPQSSQEPPGATQHLLLAQWPSARRHELDARLSPDRPKSQKSSVIVQSRESVLRDQITAAKKTRAVQSPKALTPPTPRPRRLTTPELSSVDDGKTFCQCDLKRSWPCVCCRQT